MVAHNNKLSSRESNTHGTYSHMQNTHTVSSLEDFKVTWFILNPSPLEEQPVFLATEPFLHPPEMTSMPFVDVYTCVPGNLCLQSLEEGIRVGDNNCL